MADPRRLIGSDLRDAPTPSAVIDVAVARKNCSQMLDACKRLGFEFRAHVKTHKTVELTSIQVGPTGPVNIVVSTLAEAEFLIPYLLECRENGRPIDLLYGFPVPPSAVPRLAELAKLLGPACVGVLVDNPDQLRHLVHFRDLPSGIAPRVFIKIDVGSRRAGTSPGSEGFVSLLRHVEDAESESLVELAGLYCHAGHSYNGVGHEAASNMLNHELSTLFEAAQSVSARDAPIKLSVGASPTAMAIGELSHPHPPTDESNSHAEWKGSGALHKVISRSREKNVSIEIHAGVYPVLDIQQLSISALPTPMLTWSNLGLSILAEVSSVYPDRGADGSPEALVTAGSLALGREPCKAYDGWGIIMPWNVGLQEQPSLDASATDLSGWVVDRISQEHGILARRRTKGTPLTLEVGQKVRIFPNHACIAAAGFDHFLVVDSGKDTGKDTIQDVWASVRGW